jgi:hypothetical protein
MSWHTRPTDDAWKRVTLAHIASLDQRIWLRCNACAHEQIVEPLAFAAFHDLEQSTPLLTIAERLVCTVCGERKAHCWPEPYSFEHKKDV